MRTPKAITRALALPLLLAVPAAAAMAAPSVQGVWITDDHKGLVQIGPCGGQICGRILKVVDAGPNVPTKDVNNPDPKLRGRPLVGLVTLSGFSQSGATWKGGRAYDPKSGKSYRSTLQLNPDGSLNVSGCVLFICESRRWTRVR
jgi:uncharacterized protein (DUF2147 family)